MDPEPENKMKTPVKIALDNSSKPEVSLSRCPPCETPVATTGCPQFTDRSLSLESLLDQGDANLKGAIMTEPNQSGLSDNAAGAIAYLTFIPAIIFLVIEPYNKNPYVRFHSWQCILLSIAAIVIDVALSIVLGIMMFMLPFFVVRVFWPIIELAWLLIWLLCIFNAFNGKLFRLPIIGDFAAKQAGN
jgi:uncharacterized membrane protein